MAKPVIIGLRELNSALNAMLEELDNLEPMYEDLAVGMRKYAHVITGYIRGSVYSKKNVSGADAPYAGFEADRGGEHDFAQKSIDAFDLDKHADRIVRAF